MSREKPFSEVVEDFINALGSGSYADYRDARDELDSKYDSLKEKVRENASDIVSLKDDVAGRIGEERRG